MAGNEEQEEAFAFFGCPHFFKVFFPHLSSKQLTIPRMFTKHISDMSSRKASLTDPRGRTWDVEMARANRHICLRKGWGKFVTHNSLSMGDFLVFRYDGRCNFSVLIFDRTACQKDINFGSKHSVEINGESNTEGRYKLEESQGGANWNRGANICEEVMHKPNHPSGNQDSCAVTKRKKNSPVDEKIQYTPRDSGRPRRFCTLKTKMAEVQSPPSVDEGLSPSCRKARGKTGSVNEDSSKGPTKIPLSCLDRVKANKKPGERTFSGSQTIHCLTSQRRPATSEELSRALKSAKSFHSKKPLAMAVMSETFVYRFFLLHLPIAFMRKHFPPGNSKMIFWDPSGRPWTVSYLAGRGFKGGWKKFSYANNLEKGDVCVFELITKKQMKVHIFRVVRKIAPLIWN